MAIAFLIAVAPVIKERPKVIRREHQKTIIIECTVQSANKPDVVWYKENSMVREDTRHQVHIKQVSQGEFAIALEIEAPDVKDKGVYKLMAKNTKGESTSQTVNVEVEGQKEEKKKEEPKGEKPKLTSKLERLEIEQGKSGSLVIRIESKTKCTVVWYHNKTVIRETTKIKSTFDGSTAELRISEATKEMSGSYSVEIKNEFGSVESSTEVVVKGNGNQSQGISLKQCCACGA